MNPAEATSPQTSSRRVFNFSAGPGTLPEEVLLEVRNELPIYDDVGASIMEISHRSEAYDRVEESARSLIKEMLGLSEDWNVLFLQGGASMQFHQVPLNFLRDGETADYVTTGRWSVKALREAELLGSPTEIASSEEEGFRYIPDPTKWERNENARYLHITTNNTVAGTQFSRIPSSSTPIVADASSDFMSRPIENIDQFGLIYAGAQKNVGPAGVTIVLIKDAFLGQRRKRLPTMLDYGTHVERRFNTPPVFAIYMVEKVMRWLKKKGGVEGIQEINEHKAALLYNYIDSSDFYRGAVKKEARSLMNATFRLPKEELEVQFIREAHGAGFHALKGHRSVGGIRASMYNACPVEAVEALVNFMQEFESTHG